MKNLAFVSFEHSQITSRIRFRINYKRFPNQNLLMKTKKLPLF